MPTKDLEQAVTYIDKPLKRKLEQRAKQLDQTVSAFIKHMLRQHLEGVKEAPSANP